MEQPITPKEKMTPLSALAPPGDTICAIASPHGSGGIATIRISGPDAFSIVNKIWRGRPLSPELDHTARLGSIIDPHDSKPLDRAVAVIFTAPRSYTGEHTIELSVHGSRFIQSRLLDILILSGCRLAEPGEFTRRAFASGNLDLPQAEAVADLIAADSRAAHHLALTQLRGSFSARIEALRADLVRLLSLLELELDFSEEDVEFAPRTELRSLTVEIHIAIDRLLASFQAGQAIKDGIPVAIIGNTNAGKSSLLNAILGHDRAIVSDTHGTTRDTIEETVHLGDFTFRFIDTAGIRQTTDAIEQIGIDRSIQALSRARIAILVIDSTTLPTGNDTSPVPDIINRTKEIIANTPSDTAPTLIIALNKADIAPEATLPADHNATSTDPYGEPIHISATTGQGLDTLSRSLVEIARTDSDNHSQGDILLTNKRHAIAFTRAAEALDDALAAIDTGLTPDLIATHLHEASHHLAAVTGAITTPDLLQSIFSSFCIGK